MKSPITHSDFQIAEILREAHEVPIGDVAMKYHISEATICAWHNKFGQARPEEIKRLRRLKLEHAKRRRSFLR
jgi:DNA-binding transcriptional regulator YiaG